jgi:hypothetical protein
MLFSWVSTAWTAAAKPPGTGLWRPWKTTCEAPWVDYMNCVVFLHSMRAAWIDDLIVEDSVIKTG